LLLGAFFFSCQRSYSPKPHSYFRIDFPDKEYRLFDSTCPFIFEYPVYGTIVNDNRPRSGHCWMNIVFPQYRGTLHLTYHEINNNFDQVIEDDWRMVYSRLSLRADDIEDFAIIDHEENVFGIMYHIKGNAASSVQFFLTDSVKHFLRGAFYFNVIPNYDSLAPAINFFRDDVLHLTQTLKWKNN